MINRYGLLIAGESGMGIDSSGEILMRALMHMGFWVTSDREYPSLIKGGQANYNINFGNQPLRGSSRTFEIGLGMGLEGLAYCLEHTSKGGTILHNFEKREVALPDLHKIAQQKNYTIHYIPTREYVLENNLHTLFENSLVIGAAAKALGMSYEVIHAAFHHKYGKKEKLRASNEACLEAGFTTIEQSALTLENQTNSPLTKGELEGVGKNAKRMFVDGNTALALGAIHAGVRTFFAYPMSPSSSILGYFAATAMETGVVVRQVEDEISAIQMTLGSMYAGTRSLTATSGGGFDLMTETISLSGMTEVPCVCVIAQRPGPATGLPTWTAQGDLLLATYAGHGEFARIVIGVADATSAYTLIQHAFNLAETYQVPVIVLTEKLIAENRQTIPLLEQGTVDIQRGLVTDPEALKQLTSNDRYKITDSGVSKRWIPTRSETVFYCNGDEHKEDGTLDESPDTAHMIQKRIKKIDAITSALPDPELLGPSSGKRLYIGRGSTVGLFQDIIDYDAPDGIAYLHIAYLTPLKDQVIQDICSKFDEIVVIENNATGQLHTLLSPKLKNVDLKKLLKRNGRQFSLEEVREHIQHSRIGK